MTSVGVFARIKSARARQAFGDGWRQLVTPEGVDLRLRVGSYVDRAIALSLDFLFVGGALVAFSLAALSVAWATRVAWMNEVLGVVWLLGLFIGRNFYFMAFEVTPRAATPGKRIMGLRVVAADGGQLTANAIFARNAMREVEVFLPLTFFAARGEGVDAALIALGAIWSGVFVIFPLFNRDRRRLGDIAAGTLVVKAPKRLLQPDLADTERQAARGVTFAPAQLDVYGEKELHVLEDVLRAADRKSVAEVAARIRARIAWDGPADIPDRMFLNAYYAGLRGHLESRMLFGRRRKDKFDT